MPRKQRKKRHPSKISRTALIQRPGRYIGREWNLPPVTSSDSLRIAICYPDVYEIGMSHLGLQVIYELLKSITGITTERVFAPWPDKEHALRQEKSLLVSLETQTPLKEFDLICFTIPHELSFTNILNILDLGGIPLRACERDSSMPFVLGGGIAVLNPTPLEMFFDGFFVGEAEEGLPKIIDAFQVNDRDHLFHALSALPGVYIPSLYSDSVAKPRVVKQYVNDLENAAHPNPPLVPYCRPIHERVVVEATRGCPRTCRFCQARSYYYPLRKRQPETIFKLIKQNLSQTGYEEVSLLSLNIADYPGIEQLLVTLMGYLSDREVSIALPSLRPEKLTPAIIEQIRQVRKTGFTLAPEAGSDRLRKIIGKPFPLKILLETVSAVFQAGWSTLKLYFMIGLPFEEDDDVRAILDLIHQVLKIGHQIAGNRVTLHVSVATFIPKPHTAFQWLGQAHEEDIRRRQNFLRNGCHSPNIKLSMDNLQTSRLEAYFSRGDARAGNVLSDAFHFGCRMDAWKEWFNFALWQKAFQANNIYLEDETTRGFPVEAGTLPWSFIDSGIKETDLRQVFEEARSDHEVSPADVAYEIPERYSAPETTKKWPVTDSGSTSRYIGVFQITSDFRLFSHMEISSAICRAMRRAAIPLAYSQGFNPHPKMSWLQPAPLGFERWLEPLEIHLKRPIAKEILLTQLNQQLPPEMCFRSIHPTNDSKPFKHLDHFVIALRTSSQFQKICDIPDIYDKLTVLAKGTFQPEIEERLNQLQMDFLCVLPCQTTMGPSLRDLLAICFDGIDMPLFPVTGVRIGWLDNRIKNMELFGLKESGFLS